MVVVEREGCSERKGESQDDASRAKGERKRERERTGETGEVEVGGEVVDRFEVGDDDRFGEPCGAGGVDLERKGREEKSQRRKRRRVETQLNPNSTSLPLGHLSSPTSSTHSSGPKSQRLTIKAGKSCSSSSVTLHSHSNPIFTALALSLAEYTSPDAIGVSLTETPSLRRGRASSAMAW